MQAVICWSCGMELGEAESDQWDEVTCPFCGLSNVIEPEQDLAEMYARHEAEDRERWIPDREPRANWEPFYVNGKWGVPHPYDD